MLATHGLITRAPKKLTGLVGLDYKDWSGQHIGEGDEFTVFRISDDEVLKVAHATLLMRRQAQEAYAERLRKEHGLMLKWLGEFSLPQQVSVEALPFLPSVTAVQVRQPYLDGSDPRLFEPLNTDVVAANLDKLLDEHPSALGQLGDFTERSHGLHGAHGLVPDTNGESNLILSGENLVMVDGQPIGIAHRPVQEVILGQLDSLALAVA
ncbi:MAG TPA: hypothetical protein VHA05_03555 [Candidatus Saccharimonadales bacterium]|nr:hypothetical protein [Candidatus Saccharimonadales bacterium]